MCEICYMRVCDFGVIPHCRVRMCDTVTPFVRVAVTIWMLFVISCDCVMYA